MCGPPSHWGSQVSFICPIREVMAAPHVLQVGAPENIFVEIQDCALETNIGVEIIVMNHPTKSRQLASAAVDLNKSNSWQAFGQILVMWTQWHRKLFSLTLIETHRGATDLPLSPGLPWWRPFPAWRDTTPGWIAALRGVLTLQLTMYSVSFRSPAKS